MNIKKYLNKIFVSTICIVILITIASTAYSIIFPPSQSVKIMMRDVSDFVGLDLYFEFGGEKPFRINNPVECKVGALLEGIKLGQEKVTFSSNLEDFLIIVYVTNTHDYNTWKAQRWYQGAIGLTAYNNTNETGEERLWTHYGSETLIFQYPGDANFDVVVYNETQQYIEKIVITNLIYLESSSQISDVLQENSVLIAAESLLLIAVIELFKMYKPE